MVYIIVPLVAGLVLGWWSRATSLPKVCSKLTLLALFVLLFLMGLQLGIDPAQRAALESLGTKAFVLALGSVAASTAGVWIVSRLEEKQ